MYIQKAILNERKQTIDFEKKPSFIDFIQFVSLSFPNSIESPGINEADRLVPEARAIDSVRPNPLDQSSFP